MIQWLQSWDVAAFRFINQGLVHPWLDQLMPWLSGNQLFYPLLGLLAIWLVWKGGSRGLVCVAMLALIVALGDGLVCRTLKEAIGRERPFLVLPDVRCLVGKGGSGSFPSSHAANWFAGAMIAFLYFRKSAWLTLPLGALVALSRVYNGVHYPSDVLGGAVLGAGYAAAGIWALDALWRWAGARWFPLWWRKLPSLANPPARLAEEESEEPVFAPRSGALGAPVPQTSVDAHWLRLGFLLIVVLLAARWCYIASDTIQLSEDEAYQWVWSKHLALSYYSKPPLIAYTQFLGTSLWGDREFGVRFFAPLITALLSALMLRFFAREVNARAGVFLLLIMTATPMIAVGSVLMTVDPLSVLFWTAAMLAGWRAVGETGTSRDWAWVGLWMGLGFLSKYTALFQWLCWAVFFVLWAPARRHLRRPGPWLALLINLLLTIPVLVWNYQHGWITVTHVSETAGAGHEWHPTLRYLGDFLGAEFGLLNPVFFTATVWAALAMWRKSRHHALLVFCFSMGAPLFLVYTLHSFYSRILPNWIVPSVLPLFCVMVIYWDTRARLGTARIKPWLITGLVFGFAVVAILHDTNLVARLTGKHLPIAMDPLRRVREWDQTAAVVGQARQELLAEGKPVFIIGNHYGLVGQVSFYLPEARAAVKTNPLVYFRHTATPQNQFFFWPGYNLRKGENAVFVNELDRTRPEPELPPAELLADFESVTEAGIRPVFYHGRVLRVLQFFHCRGVR